MKAAMIFIVWNWGITPTWVNAVATILLGISIVNDVFGGD